MQVIVNNKINEIKLTSGSALRLILLFKNIILTIQRSKNQSFKVFISG